MRILFFTSSTNDYMEDCLLHGLRNIFGSELVDFPKKHHMYYHSNETSTLVHGLGFTLTGLLKEIEINRTAIKEKIKQNYFDLIIFPCIYRQYDTFLKYNKYLDPYKTVFVDGSDSSRHISELTFYLKKTLVSKTPKIFPESIYFKRELTERTSLRFPKKFYCNFLNKFFPVYRENIKSISFGIPEEKILNTIPIKNKKWPKHIVDLEILDYISNAKDSYVFDNEDEYYKDLQSSKYGITTKRSGWDCMRHYEIAANGSLICFRDLDKKPSSCAPYGLIDGWNCISYSSFNHLVCQLNNLSEKKYHAIVNNSLKWVKSKTTLSVASHFIDDIKNYQKAL